jgi:prophage antirepressor-like protein
VALGYTNPRKALMDHVDTEDKGVTKCDTLGGTQEMTTINESGLYSLIFGSKLQKAKGFKRWVTSEVLPSIRKTGEYKVNDAKVKSHKEDVLEVIKSLPNDDHKNLAVQQIMKFINSENNLKILSRQKTEMSERDFRDLVLEFMNENDVVIKRHKQGLVIDKEALYKYFNQYGWTEHNVLEALDEYKMIYHKGEDRTHQLTLDGKLVRVLIIQ